MCIWTLCTLNLLTLPIGICADYIVLLLSLDVRSYVKNSCTSLRLVADLRWLCCILIVTCKVACVLFLVKVSFFTWCSIFLSCVNVQGTLSAVVGSVVSSRSIEKVWRRKNATDVFAHEDERHRASSARVEHAEPFNMPPVLNSIFTAYPIFPLLVHEKKKNADDWGAEVWRKCNGQKLGAHPVNRTRTNHDQTRTSSIYRHPSGASYSHHSPLSTAVLQSCPPKTFSISTK